MRFNEVLHGSLKFQNVVEVSVGFSQVSFYQVLEGTVWFIKTLSGCIL